MMQSYQLAPYQGKLHTQLFQLGGLQCTEYPDNCEILKLRQQLHKQKFLKYASPKCLRYLSPSLCDFIIIFQIEFQYEKFPSKSNMK